MQYKEKHATKTFVPIVTTVLKKKLKQNFNMAMIAFFYSYIMDNPKDNIRRTCKVACHLSLQDSLTCEMQYLSTPQE